MNIPVIKVAIVTSQVGSDTIVFTTPLKDANGDPITMQMTIAKNQAQELMRINFPSIVPTIYE
jgi:hypothetical protein